MKVIHESARANNQSIIPRMGMGEVKGGGKGGDSGIGNGRGKGLATRFHGSDGDGTAGRLTFISCLATSSNCTATGRDVIALAGLS